MRVGLQTLHTHSYMYYMLVVPMKRLMTWVLSSSIWTHPLWHPQWPCWNIHFINVICPVLTIMSHLYGDVTYALLMTSPMAFCKSSKPCFFHIELYASVKSPVVNLAKLLPLYLRQPALTDMEVFFLFFFFSAIFADILFSSERKWGATLNRKLLGFLDNEANALNTKSCLPFALQL